jgi:hypothetical protein
MGFVCLVTDPDTDVRQGGAVITVNHLDLPAKVQQNLQGVIQIPVLFPTTVPWWSRADGHIHHQ